MTNEVKRAIAAEAANAEAIAAEKARAESAENSIAGDLTNEVKRAIAAEAANAEAIAVENARAERVESAIADAITAITSGSTFRALYIAAGAEYNGSGVDKTKTTPWGETVIHKAGHYYLNGLGDITEAEMMDIYNYKDVIYRLDCPRILQNRKARTIFPCVQNALESILSSRKLNGTYSFYGSSIEELNFHLSSQIEFSKGRLLPASEYLYETFANCAKLRNIGGINCASVAQFYNTFGGCTSLEQVRLYNVAKNLSLASSSKISKTSILYIVQYAAPASAITVTLHPDAYARLANDAEIVAALEAQPLITLVSA